MSHPVRPGRQARPLRRWRTDASAALAVAVLVVAGCAAGAPSRTEFVDALRTTGLSQSEAGCVADAVLDELTEDEVALIVDRGPSGAPVDDATQGRDSLERVRAAVAACEVAVPTEPAAEPGAEVEDTPDVDGEDPADGADPVEGVVSPEDDPSPTAPDEGGAGDPEGVGTEDDRGPVADG
jgi:hypothetical protein